MLERILDVMIRIRQVKIEVKKDKEEERKRKIAQKLGVSVQDILTYEIRKQSLDARKKDQIFYVYEFDVSLSSSLEKRILKKGEKDIFASFEECYQVPKYGSQGLKNRPVVVGSGPAGLFAAYLLADNGYEPLVIERGDPVEKRKKVVEKFWETGELDPESNVQFGEGGAGTFSDGKLNTLTKGDAFRGKKVFETFVKYGAPKEILYVQKPHIGTDLLSEVVKHMRNAILSYGGEFRYRTCLTDFVLEDHKLKGIEVNHQEFIPCETLVLAIGHSARDTFSLLYDKGFSMQAKPFAVGVRVQHPQKEIDLAQYGEKYYPYLSKASYKLTYQTKKKRGVYSFCMCPGGYVVNASSEEGHLVVNGMSNHARESENANSAIVVTVGPEDFGSSPLDGVKYQRNLESMAYRIGNGKIPVQLWKDFKANKVSTAFGSVHPCFKGDYVFTNLKESFPKFLSESLEEAIPAFAKKIKGFDMEDMLVAGIESRTSSPVRLNRDEDCVSNFEGVYPCGEGAGYAGGITTAAMDGIKVAEKIIGVYAPLQKKSS